MILDKKMADGVIEELRPIINFDVNLIGNNGLIISSTDKLRENTLHFGALKLVEENLDNLIIYSDDEYEGCKRGVNLPIIINNNRVAIVGITGDPIITLKYCNIIQKMTELMIQYSIEYDKRIVKTRSDLLLINNLILGNFNAFKDNVEDQITRRGLKINGPFCVAIFNILNTAGPLMDNDYSMNPAVEYIIKHLNSKHIICTETDSMFVAISSTSSDRLMAIMTSLKKHLEKNFSLSLICHIGNDKPDYRGIQRSYNEALLLSNHTQADIPEVYSFNIARLNIAIEQIPSSTKENIFYSVFRNCTDNETSEFCSFILTYFDANGSLIKVSEKTYQHKNTIQYKINKLNNKTDLDIRHYYDLFILYIAALFYNDNFND